MGSGDNKAEEAAVPVGADHASSSSSSSSSDKVKSLLGLLTRFVGVRDVVSARLSLPATLLDPVSNLEFWNYMDRPDLFVTINDPEDTLDRMLRVLRWWFSKDTKWQRNRLAKPYNSVLGEQFLCQWHIHDNDNEKKNDKYKNVKNSDNKTLTVAAQRPDVFCITEQICHHPPVSGFYYHAPRQNISAYGIDHICAKFTGTALKAYAGDRNKGIFIKLGNREDEEYHLTHPHALVNGWLRASLYITVGGTCVVSCPKSKLRAIIEYKDEPFFGKPKFEIIGKIFSYDPDTDTTDPHTITTCSKVDDAKVVCNLWGSWKGQINYIKTRTKSQSPTVLIDTSLLEAYEKEVAPIEEQSDMESRKIWLPVTTAILGKRFDEATAEKRKLEERQREKARERKDKGEVFESFWFRTYGPGKDEIPDGRPEIRSDRINQLPWHTI